MYSFDAVSTSTIIWSYIHPLDDMPCDAKYFNQQQWGYGTDSLPGAIFIPQVTYQSEVVGRPFKLLQYRLMSCTFVVFQFFGWFVLSRAGENSLILFVRLAFKLDIMHLRVKNKWHDNTKFCSLASAFHTVNTFLRRWGGQKTLHLVGVLQDRKCTCNITLRHIHFFTPQTLLRYLMFCWSCIVIYLYSKNQQDALFTFNLFQ